MAQAHSLGMTFLALPSTEAQPQNEVSTELLDPQLGIALHTHDPVTHWLLPTAAVPYPTLWVFGRLCHEAGGSLRV